MSLDGFKLKGHIVFLGYIVKKSRRKHSVGILLAELKGLAKVSELFLDSHYVTGSFFRYSCYYFLFQKIKILQDTAPFA